MADENLLFADTKLGALCSDAFTGKDMINDVVIMLEVVSDKPDDELRDVAGLIVLYVANQIKGKIKSAIKGEAK